MKLQDQVTSLELSKRLYELGVSYDSFFEWTDKDILTYDLEAEMNGREKVGHKKYPAYTATELGEILPRFIKDYDLSIKYTVETGSSPWECVVSYREYLYEGTVDILGDFRAVDIKEADARAKMLIYLLENKLITL